MKTRLQRIVAALGVMVLVIVLYESSQIYKGQLSNQYSVDVQKQTQGSDNGSRASNSARGSVEISSAAPPQPNQAPPSAVSITQDPSTYSAKPDSSAPITTSDTPSSRIYKQSMSRTYKQTLQTMEVIKTNTLALQSRKMSLSSYKASIIQSQTAFSLAEAYVRANPPIDAKLNTSYQELLGGISLAKQAMGVVLNGISTFSVSELYSAREMGITAQQQVVNGYSHL